MKTDYSKLTIEQLVEGKREKLENLSRLKSQLHDLEVEIALINNIIAREKNIGQKQELESV